MARTRRRQDPALIEQLSQEPHRFDFFQAVRILEQAARPDGSTAEPIGHDADPRQEAVRLHASPTTAFPAAELDAVIQKEDGPPVLQATFMGLFGPSGVLPPHYTEALIRALRQRQPGMGDFLNLFNHRTLSLFHRAWAKYRLPQRYGEQGEGERSRGERNQGERGQGERGQGERGQGKQAGLDPISASIYALCGLDTPHLQDRLAVDDQVVAHYSGHISHAPKSAVALQDMLSDYFGLPVAIEQLIGRWLPLPEGERSRIGMALCALDRDAIVGDRVYDVQGHFRIVIGPVGRARFDTLLPDGDGMRELVDLVQLHVGLGMTFEVQVLLRRDEVPASSLGGETRLGWSSWVKEKPFVQDARDAVFLMAMP